jgi:hypothetical protein
MNSRDCSDLPCLSKLVSNRIDEYRVLLNSNCKLLSQLVIALVDTFWR